jgi:hypothetical protein
LVFTPVLRLEAETVEGIFSLEWDGPLSILLQRDNPQVTGYANHWHQYERGQEVFLRGRYEAMLVIEDDVIPPKEALTRLARLECDIAYGCYVFKGGEVVNVLERYTSWPKTTRNFGESLTVRGLWQAAVRKGIVECSGSGFGCTLIRRGVLEETPFCEVPGAFFDWAWTEAAFRKGYRMMADTGIVCGHKFPDGSVRWPASVH